MNLARSNDEPDVSSATTNINVRFVSISPLQLQIKHAMKNSAQIQDEPIIPSLFQVASRFENFAPAIIPRSVPPLMQTPFVELMLHPEKLEMALLTAKKQNDAFAQSRRTRGVNLTKQAERNMPAKSAIRKDRSRKQIAVIPSGLINVEFSLEAPFAQSVKLAADFTEWEKFPLDMIKSEDGVWYTVVPLPSGDYAYRFIVDGQWCDDPHPALLVPNPFGTANAVVKVMLA